MPTRPAHAAAAPPEPPAPPAPPQECAGAEAALSRALFVVHHAMMRVGDRLAARIGLTSSRWLLLCALGRCEEEPTIARLSELSTLSPQNVSRMIAAMEDEGLVRRKARRSGGHAVSVHLTPRGERALEATHNLATEFQQGFLRGFDAAEIRNLDAALARLMKNLEDFEASLADRPHTGAATS